MTRTSADRFPATPDGVPPKQKAMIVENVAQFLAVADLVPEASLHEHFRQLAQFLPGLWADGELPEPIAELVRRFGPEAR